MEECFFVYHLGPNPVKNLLDIVPLCERARCLIGIGNFSRSNMEEANPPTKNLLRLDEVILLMATGNPAN